MKFLPEDDREAEFVAWCKRNDLDPDETDLSLFEEAMGESRESLIKKAEQSKEDPWANYNYEDEV